MNGEGIPWAILLPVTGGAGVLVFQHFGWNSRLIRIWVVTTLAMSLTAFTLLSEPATGIAWTQSLVTILCVTGLIVTLSSTGPVSVSNRSAPIDPHLTKSSPDGSAHALMLFSLATFTVVCHAESLATLLAAHAAFLFVSSGGVPSVPVCGHNVRQSLVTGVDSYLLPLSLVFPVAGAGLLIALGGSDDLHSIQQTLRDNYQPVRQELTVGTASILGTVSFILILAGIAIPFAIFPFHSGRVESFADQPAWLASGNAIASRAHAFVVLWRISVTAMPGFGPQVQTPMLVLAAASAAAGACLACRSRSLRELAGNCWLVNGGLLLHCIATGAGQVSMVRDDPGWQLPNALETGLYLFICSSAALLTVMLIESSFELPDRRLEFDEDLSGLGRQRPLTGGILASGLLAFCGLPPLASFWGIVYLHAGAFVPQYEASDSAILVPNAAVLLTAGGLVIALLILTARIVRLLSLIFFEEPLRRHREAAGLPLIMAGGLAAALVFTGLLPARLMRAIHDSL
ncbi:MAG: proton-conducting transporter membrane subunit [Planctomycetaceae bacterium]